MAIERARLLTVQEQLTEAGKVVDQMQEFLKNGDIKLAEEKRLQLGGYFQRVSQINQQFSNLKNSLADIHVNDPPLEEKTILPQSIPQQESVVIQESELVETPQGQQGEDKQKIEAVEVAKPEEKEELTDRQISILSYLAQRGGREERVVLVDRLTEQWRYIGKYRGSVFDGSAKKLFEKQFIRKENSEEGKRRVTFELTEKGTGILGALGLNQVESISAQNVDIERKPEVIKEDTTKPSKSLLALGFLYKKDQVGEQVTGVNEPTKTIYGVLTGGNRQKAYQLFESLVKQGLVEKRKEGRSNVYIITENGKKRCEEDIQDSDSILPDQRLDLPQAKEKTLEVKTSELQEAEITINGGSGNIIRIGGNMHILDEPEARFLTAFEGLEPGSYILKPVLAEKVYQDPYKVQELEDLHRTVLTRIGDKPYRSNLIVSIAVPGDSGVVGAFQSNLRVTVVRVENKENAKEPETTIYEAQGDLTKQEISIADNLGILEEAQDIEGISPDILYTIACRVKELSYGSLQNLNLAISNGSIRDRAQKVADILEGEKYLKQFRGEITRSKVEEIINSFLDNPILTLNRYSEDNEVQGFLTLFSSLNKKEIHVLTSTLKVT